MGKEVFDCQKFAENKPFIFYNQFLVHIRKQRILILVVEKKIASSANIIGLRRLLHLPQKGLFQHVLSNNNSLTVHPSGDN